MKRLPSKTIFRLLSLVILLVTVVLVTRWLPSAWIMEAIGGWTEKHPLAGPLAFGLFYVVATLLFVPGTVLTMAAGAIFGLNEGFVVVSISSSLGAAFAFLIARYWVREKVAAKAEANPRFGSIDRAIEHGGWRIVALLRLSLAIPFNFQNYMLGVTKVKFWPYLLTSWIAMIPGTFLYVYLGHLAAVSVVGQPSGNDHTGALIGQWFLLAVGLVATVTVSLYVVKLIKRQLREDVQWSPQPPIDSTESIEKLGVGPAPRSDHETSAVVIPPGSVA